MLPLDRRGFLLAVVLVLSLGPAAQAVMITNVTTGRLLFFDDFEGVGINVSHAVHPDASGDYDPIARIGTWTVTESTAAMGQVTDSLLSPDPGPAQGLNYLRMNREGTFNALTGDLVQAQSLAGHAGEQIHWEMMVNVLPGVNLPAIFGLFDGGNHLAHVVADTSAKTIKVFKPGNVLLSTGLPFAPGEWTKMELDYVIGANSYAMTVNGQTASDLPLYSATAGGVSRIRITGNAGGGTYFDQAVP